MLQKKIQARFTGEQVDHLVVFPSKNSVTTNQIILKPFMLSFILFQSEKKLFERERLIVTENQSALHSVPQKQLNKVEAEGILENRWLLPCQQSQRKRGTYFKWFKQENKAPEKERDLIYQGQD